MKGDWETASTVGRGVLRTSSDGHARNLSPAGATQSRSPQRLRVLDVILHPSSFIPHPSHFVLLSRLLSHHACHSRRMAPDTRRLSAMLKLGQGWPKIITRTQSRTA